jgi:hypothetical protein
MKTTTILGFASALILTCAGLSGCATRTGTGALAGGTAGAVVAGPAGAVVGAGVGAVGGAAMDESDRRRRR